MQIGGYYYIAIGYVLGDKLNIHQSFHKSGSALHKLIFNRGRSNECLLYVQLKNAFERLAF